MASFCFNLCRCCMAHGFSTKLTSVFENDGKHAHLMEQLLGIDVSVDKGRYDAWICNACADKLEVLLELQCKASFANEVYFSRTRAACEQLKAMKALTAEKALENTKAESGDALKVTEATPDTWFGVSIKLERQDDSDEVPFVTRIPLENIKSEPIESSDDFIHSQNVYKKRKVEEDEPETPKQKGKSKTKQNSMTKQEKYEAGRVNCHICGLLVSSKYSLKRHIDRHHKQTVVYKCGFCENSYNSMEEYKEHNIAAHQDIFEDFFKRNGAVDLLQQLKDEHFDQNFGLRRVSKL